MNSILNLRFEEGVLTADQAVINARNARGPLRNHVLVVDEMVWLFDASACSAALGWLLRSQRINLDADDTGHLGIAIKSLKAKVIHQGSGLLAWICNPSACTTGKQHCASSHNKYFQRHSGLSQSIEKPNYRQTHFPATQLDADRPREPHAIQS